MRRSLLAVVALAAALPGRAGEDAELASAKALDGEIRGLKELPDGERADAIHRAGQSIGKFSPKYAVPLALNLVIDGTAGSGRASLQEIADVLSRTLANAPPQFLGGGYRSLAELARYSGVRVTTKHPQYKAAMRALEAEDRRRQQADFTLADLEGKVWNLKALRGKVVLVNFWATWCPPCRQELPDLQEAYSRFGHSGFVVLAITDEEAEKVRRFAEEKRLNFPILSDPGKAARRALLVNGIPVSFLFSRSGELIAQVWARPDRQGPLEMLGKAGLR